MARPHFRPVSESPLPTLSRRRAVIAAWLMATLMLLAIAHGARSGLPAWPAGVAAWGAGLALWPRLDRRQRRFALTLSAVGGVAMLLAQWRGMSPNWTGVLTQNTALLGMLAAVSFLQLVGMGQAGQTELPRGRRALWQTLLGVHVLGAFINMSVVFIVAERLALTGGLTARQAAALSRGFLAAALWSPFFGAMAVALTYAPGAHLAEVALAGAPLAAVVLWLAVRTLPPPQPGEPPEFVGFPVHASALWLPLVLTVLVATGLALLPGWSSLAVIGAAALALSTLAVLASHGVIEGLDALGGHALRRLPAMSGELMLFLAAGVFATGLQALLRGDAAWAPLDYFGALHAAVLLGLMIALSAIGVHTVVTIVIASAWLAPLSPDPLLMAQVYLMSWAIGLPLNPMSGVHLSLQGRFGLSAISLARANLKYCLTSYAVAAAWLAGQGAVRGIL